MFINWIIGFLSKKRNTESSKLYPMVFSIHENEIEEFLDWMRDHSCSYTKNSRAKKLLSEYSNKEIISNGLVSTAFEEYGSDLSKNENTFSIMLYPLVSGTDYRLKCSCGQEFIPSYNKARTKTA